MTLEIISSAVYVSQNMLFHSYVEYNMTIYTYHKIFYKVSSAACSKDFEMNPAMPAAVYLRSPCALDKW